MDIDIYRYIYRYILQENLVHRNTPCFSRCNKQEARLLDARDSAREGIGEPGEANILFTPPKTNSIVGRCISYWNSPLFRGHVSFLGSILTCFLFMGHEHLFWFGIWIMARWMNAFHHFQSMDDASGSILSSFCIQIYATQGYEKRNNKHN